MSSKLYTTYASNLKNVPKGVVICSIMQMPLAFMKKEGIVNIPQLAPLTKNLVAYKRGGSWETFEAKFKEQMYSNKDTIDYLILLMEALDEDDNDVCLVCCEKDNTYCHRRLIAEYLRDLGYQVEELPTG